MNVLSAWGGGREDHEDEDRKKRGVPEGDERDKEGHIPGGPGAGDTSSVEAAVMVEIDDTALAEAAVMSLPHRRTPHAASRAKGRPVVALNVSQAVERGA